MSNQKLELIQRKAEEQFKEAQKKQKKQLKKQVQDPDIIKSFKRSSDPVANG